MQKALIVCSILIFSEAAFSEDWPAFRGPRGDGHSDAKALPLRWSATQNIAWKIPIAGEAWSSPAIVGGKIYLTTAVKNGPEDYDRSLRALCLEAKTGKTLWDAEIFAQKAASSPKKHNKASHANPTPIVEGDRMYVHFGHQGTAALSLAGKVIWRNHDFPYTPTHGNGGSPILVDELLIFAIDASDLQALIALDKNTGKLRWKTPRDNNARRSFTFSTPTLIQVGDQRQVISPSSEYVMAYEPATGKELWRVHYPGGYSVIPRPLYAHGLVFACSGYDRPSLHAIKPGGSGDITQTNVVWSVNRDVPHTPSLLIVGDELYMVADKGVASCLDAKTGKVHWTQRIGGNYSASPIFAAGRIYFLSEEGKTTVIKPGKIFEQLSVNEIGERTLASFAVSDGSIFLRSDQHLYRITGK